MHNSTMKDIFGTNLKNLRDELGFTQGQLAKSIGVDIKTMGRYERGEFAPKLDLIEAICKAHELEPNDLLTVPGNETSSSTEKVIEEANSVVEDCKAQLDSYIKTLLKVERATSTIPLTNDIVNLLIEINEKPLIEALSEDIIAYAEAKGVSSRSLFNDDYELISKLDSSNKKSVS